MNFMLFVAFTKKKKKKDLFDQKSSFLSVKYRMSVENRENQNVLPETEELENLKHFPYPTCHNITNLVPM
jgi:hypothetical protein